VLGVGIRKRPLLIFSARIFHPFRTPRDRTTRELAYDGRLMRTTVSSSPRRA